MIATATLETRPSQTSPPPEQRSDDVWAYISPSRLNCWLRCPLAFKFHYLDGLRTPPTPALFLGKRVHQALETWYRHQQLGLPLAIEDVLARMPDQWDNAVKIEAIEFPSAENEQAQRQQAEDLVAVYLRHCSADDARPLAVEATLQSELIDPTTGEAFGISLLGVLDVIFAEVAGPRIADFKTAAKSAGPLELQHEVQLTAYSYLFRASSGQQETGLEIRTLVKTKTPKTQVHHYAPRDPQHFARLFAVVREYLDALERRQFNYRPGWHCATCEYAAGPCRVWSG